MKTVFPCENYYTWENPFLALFWPCSGPVLACSVIFFMLFTKLQVDVAYVHNPSFVLHLDYEAFWLKKIKRNMI